MLECSRSRLTWNPMNSNPKRSEIKRIFRQHGLAPKKWMGQNLLVDPAYLGRIVEAAQIQPGQPVVEVGAGLGVLTEALVEEGARVWALEVDAGFFRVLEQKLEGRDEVQLIHADVLKFDFRRLRERLGPLKVVANLPYNISSRLIFRFHEEQDMFSSLTILLQKEVAERLMASPGTKDYGILTVLLGVSAIVENLFDIPGEAFFPVPKVRSTLVRVRFQNPPPLAAADPSLLIRVVKSSFAARRKTLRNSLRSGSIPGLTEPILSESAQAADIDLRRRPETLTPEEFVRFSDEIHKRLS